MQDEIQLCVGELAQHSGESRRCRAGAGTSSGPLSRTQVRQALAADRPVLLEAITDPEVPPLPPHIRFEQAKNMAKALAGGEAERGRIIRQTLKGKAQELLRR